MPKDNSLLPNDNNQQTAVTPPPVLEDVVLPPMINKSDTPAVNNDEPKQSSGSAAPTDDIVMSTTQISSNPRKKFAGGKVIATILGLFLLVGGVGAGVMLTQQNQDIRENACDPGVPYNECFDGVATLSEKPNLAPGETETCGMRDGEEICVVYAANGGTVGEYRIVGSGGGGDGCVNRSVDCPPETTIDLTQVVKTDCVFQWDGQYCRPGGTAQRITDCCGNTNTNENGDEVCVNGNYQYTTYVCVANSTPPTTPPVITPSPAPITASCQNVKAYTAAWVELSATQLTTLKATDHVNFCVVGVANGGSFDKAKFMINNIEQPETTTKRPSSEDFCQLYVIPTGVNSYNVVAQIHHVTLGWK